MFKCKICGKKYTELTALYNHIESKHKDMIPQDMSVQQYYYYMKTGKMNGNCVMCKQPTSWNSNTGKYNRFCGNPKCKDEYVKIMKSRMVAKYGKTHLLNDPNKQREMLANRSISGVYEWSDGKHETTYTGSYELDFLKTLDHFFEWDPEDISMPSPHTYTYKYEGEDKFYIPDVFIHSLDLEIEIKDGGDNPNNHYKIQAVDKHKEALKDEVLCSQKMFHYIKITNKNYENFFQFLKEAKKEFEKYGDEKKIPRIFKIEDIKGTNIKPIKESIEIIDESYFRNKKDLYVNFELFDSGQRNICLITGLSGSGKSTLSEQLCSKYGAKCIALDVFEHPDMEIGPYSHRTIYDKYFKNKENLKQRLINNDLNNADLALEMSNALSYIINYCEQHPNEKFIVEGLQIFADINPDFVKGLPIIFVNTSMINSMIRKYKRDKYHYKLADLFEWYIADEKKFAGFKNELLEESSDNIIDIAVKKFNDWNDKPYREYDMFLSLKYDLIKNDPKELQNFLSSLIKAARFKDDVVYIEKIVKCTDDHYKKLMRKYPDSKDRYNEYYNWVKKGMQGEIKDRKKKYDLRESYDHIEENLIFSKDHMEFNLDKFGKSENILYITGLGGSGKSTIISEYGKKYNAEALEFDAITSALIHGLENLNRNKIHPIILEYLETQNPNKLNGFNDPGFNVECVKFLDWFENRVTKDDKLYILEGMQIFICFNPERFVGKPMVIMGTSVVKSMFRSVSRRYKRSEGDIIKTFEFFLKTLKRTPIFVKNDKQISTLVVTMNESYIIDTMKESSISIPQMNYYLQNEYEEEMRKYLNTYKKYYNLMLKEQPSAVKHINEDIRKCLIVIDGLAEKGVENNLVQFAKDDLGEIVKAAKHGKPVKVFEGTNTVNLKIVYANPNSKQVFSLSDMSSKIIVEEDYIIQRDKVGTHCSVTPYYNNIDRLNEVSFQIELPEYIEIDSVFNNLAEGVIIANLFKFEDQEFKFIKEASLKLFGHYPTKVRKNKPMTTTEIADDLEQRFIKIKEKHNNASYNIDEFLVEPREYFIQFFGNKGELCYKKSFKVSEHPNLDKELIKRLKKHGK